MKTSYNTLKPNMTKISMNPSIGFGKKKPNMFFGCFHINFKVICNGFWNCCKQFSYLHATFNKMRYKK